MAFSVTEAYAVRHAYPAMLLSFYYRIFFYHCFYTLAFSQTA